MFAEFLKRNDFYRYYIEHYAIKMASSNLAIENHDGIVKNNRTINIYENIISFINLINKNDDVTPYDLIDIADNINKNQGISKGFRKTQVQIKKAIFFPINPYMVPQAIYNVFDNYYKTWCDLNVYEREARFHIDLVRIQPFEDGNKRTALIITNYNLCRQNRAPVIIDKTEIDEYWEYINNYNIDGMTKFLKRKSEKEFEDMLKMYEKRCGLNLESNEKETKDFTHIINKILKDINNLDSNNKTKSKSIDKN